LIRFASTFSFIQWKSCLTFGASLSIDTTFTMRRAIQAFTWRIIIITRHALTRFISSVKFIMLTWITFTCAIYRLWLKMWFFVTFVTLLLWTTNITTSHWTLWAVWTFAIKIISINAYAISLTIHLKMIWNITLFASILCKTC
jgi:hypothetical protein